MCLREAADRSKQIPSRRQSNRRARERADTRMRESSPSIGGCRVVRSRDAAAAEGTPRSQGLETPLRFCGERDFHGPHCGQFLMKRFTPADTRMR